MQRTRAQPSQCKEKGRNRCNAKKMGPTVAMQRKWAQPLQCEDENATVALQQKNRCSAKEERCNAKSAPGTIQSCTKCETFESLKFPSTRHSSAPPKLCNANKTPVVAKKRGPTVAMQRKGAQPLQCKEKGPNRCIAKERPKDAAAQERPSTSPLHCDGCPHFCCNATVKSISSATKPFTLHCKGLWLQCKVLLRTNRNFRMFRILATL